MAGEWYTQCDEHEILLEHFRKLGGYFNKNAKENLSLNRNTRRYLQIISRDENDARFEFKTIAHGMEGILGKFFLDLDPYLHYSPLLYGKFSNSGKEWEANGSFVAYEFNNIHLEKEVLTISQEVRNFLSDRAPSRCKHIIFQKKTRTAVKNLLFEELLPFAARKKNYYKNIPVMVTRSEAVGNFSLDVISNVPTPEWINTIVKFSELPSKKSTKRLIIDLITFPGPKVASLRFGCISRMPEWVSSQVFPNFRLEAVKLSARDEEFHSLDIYRLSEGSSLYGSKLCHTVGYKLPKKKWRIDKNILRNLEWEPFSKLVLPTNIELMEKVEGQLMYLGPSLLNFVRVKDRRIDLISVLDAPTKQDKTQLNYGPSISKIDKTDAEENEITVNISKDVPLAEISHKRALSDNSSFIDNELMSIITSKKSKLKTSLNLSKQVPQDNVRDQVDVELYVQEAMKKPRNFNSVIIVNAASIEKHHTIFNMLKKMGLIALEVETYDACDIVLGPASCLTILDLNQILHEVGLQKTECFDAVQKLKSRYKEVIVLLTCSDQALLSDMDLAFKVQLLLTCCGISCHLMEKSNYHLVLDWIKIYVQPMKLSEEVLYSWNIEKQVLLDLGIHPVATNTILRECPFKAFLSMSAGKRVLKYSNILTKTQLDRIDQFVSLAW